jgi:hypothetical protein
MCSAVHAQPATFRLVAGDAPAVLQKTTEPTVIRERGVAIDELAVERAVEAGSRDIEIAFFDDAVYRVDIERAEETSSGGVAFAGRVAGEPFSSVTIVVNPDAIVVLLVSAGKRFEIAGTAETGYVAREKADRDLPEHGAHADALDSPTAPFLAKAASGASEGAALADDGSTIDVAVIYTTNVRLAYGGTAQVNAAVDAQIALTNTIYANSNVVQRLRLVYKGEVGYTETDHSTDRARLENVSDGYLDEVPVLRDMYGADIVSFWGRGPGYSALCGIGLVMTPEDTSFAPSAINVLYAPACTGAGNFSFAHELGHNMGLRHDNFRDPGPTTVTPEGTSLATSINYAHGYVDVVNRFRTVMAYSDQCDKQTPPISCPSAPYFSNPAISFSNAAYAGASSAPTGNAALANAAQALNDTRDTTANFRRAVSLSGAGSVGFLPPNYTVAEGNGTVTLTVGRHAGSSGTVSVGYATQSGTADAGSDFTATNGTLTWADGELGNKTVTIPIVQDSAVEGTEFFTVTLSNPTGGASIPASGATATIRILDDEADNFPTTNALPPGYTSPNNPNARTPDSRWTVDTSQGYRSQWSLRSAQARTATNSSMEPGYSDLEYSGTFAAGDVSFYYKLSSYDRGVAGFEFQIDGKTVFSNGVGGEVDWTPVRVSITPGTHVLRWRFWNHQFNFCNSIAPPPPGGYSCADRAWIDGVSLPTASAQQGVNPAQRPTDIRIRAGRQ